MIFEILLILFSGLLFSIVASFADSFAWRIGRAYYSPERKKISDKIEYILKKKSCCEYCQAPIRAAGLVPVLGYFLVSGKCHECERKISWRFPALEFTAFIYGSAIAAHNAQPWFVIFTLVSLVPIYIICTIDYRWFLIPTETIFVILLMGLIELLFFRADVFTDLGRERMTLHLSGAFLWYFLFHLIRILSGKKIGLADVRLVLAFGLFLGFPGSLFLPTVAAALAIVLYLIRKNSMFFGIPKSEKIPFGVFLSLSFLLLRFL